MPFRQRFGLMGTWEFLGVVLVVCIVTLTAGVTAYIRATTAVNKICETANDNRRGLVDLAERYYEAAGSPPEFADDIERFRDDYPPLDC